MKKELQGALKLPKASSRGFNKQASQMKLPIEMSSLPDRKLTDLFSLGSKSKPSVSQHHTNCES